ncbi:hypothetical protein HMSSN139_48010 [Paenibacillus sp. HMSSN-139]|nr:hypothetical protein HMSSN139_48010 [Paenibacillus sp. HMSSN-139]
MYSSRGDRVMVGFIYTFLTLFALSTLYPFLNAIAISLNEGLDTAKGGITLWPRAFTLENYEVVFQDERLMSGFVVSVARTVVGTVSAILATAIFSYGMTKRELMGRKGYMLICIFTMYFPAA